MQEAERAIAPEWLGRKILLFLEGTIFLIWFASAISRNLGSKKGFPEAGRARHTRLTIQKRNSVIHNPFSYSANRIEKFLGAGLSARGWGFRDARPSLSPRRKQNTLTTMPTQCSKCHGSGCPGGWLLTKAAICSETSSKRTQPVGNHESISQQEESS